jgi:hypothetical protein
LADIKKVCSSLKGSSAQIGFMPLDDEGIWLGDKLEGTQIIGPERECAELALRKEKQIELAKLCGFSVPSTKYVESVDEVLRNDFEYPVVLKPAHAVLVSHNRLSKERSWTCSDKSELELAVSNWNGRWPLLVQKYVRGIGEGIFGLATSEGVVAWSTHRRVRMMNPEGSGSSACQATESQDDVRKSAAECFIKKSGWRGLFMIELLRDLSGKVWFVELNGRAWGSMALARRTGFEYPAWAAQMVFEPDKQMTFPVRKNDAIVCRHLGRELLHLLFVLRGPKSKALEAWPSGWATLAQLCRLKHSDRWYNWRRDDAKVFLADSYRTVRDQVFKARH